MWQQKSLKQILADVVLIGLLSFIIFTPITGLILKGFTVEAHWLRPINITLLIMLGRFITLMSFNQQHLYLKWQHFYNNRYAPISVRTEATALSKKLFMALAVLISITIPLLLGKYWLTVAILALIYVLLGLGLNIVIGLAGLLDLGYVAFYAVGAYTLALGAQYWGLGFWSAIPCAAIIAAMTGALLGFPVLRMHGDYLAIVTLGFGEIIRLILNNWIAVTGGPNGVSAPYPTFFGIEFTRFAKYGGTPLHKFLHMDYQSVYRYWFIYAVLLIFVAAAIYFVYRLKYMPLGRAWEAIREDEIAARSLGINPVLTKLTAFSLGAMIGGVGGVFFATYQGFINPSSFTFIESALILAIVVLGGTGSILGVIIAAIVLTILPEVLRDFAHFRMLVFGGLMVWMMILRPRGLIRIQRPLIKRPAHG